MNIKKCSKCGWEFPATYKSRRCKFCGTQFRMGYCNCCGEWKETLRANKWVCRECETKVHKEWRQQRRDASIAKYKNWLEKIAKAPSKTLTEEEWLEACRHFGGCAYCGKPHIDARSMFISFKDGGRYCAWNVIPACEKCETALKGSNPFKWMDGSINRNSYGPPKALGVSTENLQKIVDYLQSKMEELK